MDNDREKAIEAALASELEAVFDATAAQPDSFALTRMAERAKDVPTSRSWKSRLGKLWSWPTAIGACAGLAALILVVNTSMDRTSAPATAVSVSTPATGTDAVNPKKTVDTVVTPPDLQTLDETGTALGEDDDSLGLDALEMPEDLAEAEAMLDAYEQMLGDS